VLYRKTHVDAMRRLMLLRHAKAEKGAPGARDHDRQLAPRGHDDAQQLGAYMAHHALLPDLVIASGAARVQETWAGIGKAFKRAPKLRSDDRLYNADAGRILGVIQEVDSGVHTLLVVGHNPGLHDLGRLLIASGDVEAREQLSEGMPTSGLLVIDIAFDDWSKLHPQCGRLDRFVSPRLLGLATD
jgi:phosphohistidine phosphatase